MDGAIGQLNIAKTYQQKGVKSNLAMFCILLVIFILLLGSFFSGKEEKPEWVKKYE